MFSKEFKYSCKREFIRIKDDLYGKIYNFFFIHHYVQCLIDFDHFKKSPDDKVGIKRYINATALGINGVKVATYRTTLNIIWKIWRKLYRGNKC